MFAAHRRPDRRSGWACSCAAGEKGLNIDFVGGTAYGGRLDRAAWTIGDSCRDLLDRGAGRRPARRRPTVERGRRPGRRSRRTRYEITYADERTTRRSSPWPTRRRGDRRRGAAGERQGPGRRSCRTVSVEQIFPPASCRRRRAARCSPSAPRRRERELVQVAIDRLLRGRAGQAAARARTTAWQASHRRRSRGERLRPDVRATPASKPATSGRCCERRVPGPAWATSTPAADAFDVIELGEAQGGPATRQMQLRRRCRTPTSGDSEA